MSSSKTARWLAPAALAGALVAVIIVASAGGGSGDGASGSATQERGATSTAARTGTTPTRTTPARRTYTVEEGDVLSAIAEKTGVPLVDIERLNPDVDAQSLHAGQKIKLAP